MQLSALLFFCTVSLSALEVAQVQVGFAGDLLPDRVQPLTVTVVNDTPQTWSGRIALRSDSGKGERQVLEATVAPGGRRLCRFTIWSEPYGYQDWELRWRDGGQGRSYRIDRRPLGGPAVVVLGPRMGAHMVNLPRLDVAALPASVSFAAGLDSLVLESLPRLTPTQRQMLRDWLRLGGRVFALPDANGAALEVADWLQLDAGPGAGRIVHLAPAGARVDEDWLRQQGYDLPSLSSASLEGDHYAVGLVGNFFPLLRGLTDPDHAWWLIWLLLVAYLAALFPGTWLLGRRLDYRLATLAFLLLVGGIAAIIGVIGRRGYGENEVLHSISLARHLGGERYDLAQWSTLFVTSSDDYRIAYDGAIGQFFACDDSQPFLGTVMPGRPQVTFANMRLFSNQPWHYRGVVQADERDVRIDGRLDAEGRLADLQVEPKDWTIASRHGHGWVGHGDKLYALEPDGPTRLRLGRLLTSNPAGHAFQNPYRFRRLTDDRAAELPGEQVCRLLARWAIGGQGLTNQWPRGHQDPQRVLVFLPAGDGRLRPLDAGAGADLCLYQFTHRLPEPLP